MAVIKHLAICFLITEKLIGFLIELILLKGETIFKVEKLIIDFLIKN